jgi:hypothetical protein
MRSFITSEFVDNIDLALGWASYMTESLGSLVRQEVGHTVPEVKTTHRRPRKSTFTVAKMHSTYRAGMCRGISYTTYIFFFQFIYFILLIVKLFPDINFPLRIVTELAAKDASRSSLFQRDCAVKVS